MQFYKGSDVAAVNSVIEQIETALVQANQTLTALSVDKNVFESIQNSLNEV